MDDSTTLDLPAPADDPNALTLADYEAAAIASLEAGPLAYYAGGAGDELTLNDNVAAWRRLAIRPHRRLRDVRRPDHARRQRAPALRPVLDLAGPGGPRRGHGAAPARALSPARA